LLRSGSLTAKDRKPGPEYLSDIISALAGMARKSKKSISGRLAIFFITKSDKKTTQIILFAKRSKFRNNLYTFPLKRESTQKAMKCSGLLGNGCPERMPRINFSLQSSGGHAKG
jgi:hypothetical protein